MGDGSGIRVAQDPWLLNAKSGLISTKLGSAYANTTVCDLMLPKEQQCDIDLIIDLFNARDINLILNIPLSCRQTEDIWLWYWIQDVKGQHTVKSSYRILRGNVDDARSNICATLWKLQIPPKVHNLKWHMLQGVLPTTDNLRSGMVEMPS